MLSLVPWEGELRCETGIGLTEEVAFADTVADTVVVAQSKTLDRRNGRPRG